MNWNNIIRQGHRWLSIVFTLTVIANIVAVATGNAMEWLYMLPLPPLFLLIPTGLYMFFLPYFGRAKAGRAMSGEG